MSRPAPRPEWEKPFRGGAFYRALARADLAHKRKGHVRAGSIGGQVVQRLYPVSTRPRDVRGRFAPITQAPHSPATGARRASKSITQEVGRMGPTNDDYSPTSVSTTARSAGRAASAATGRAAGRS